MSLGHQTSISIRTPSSMKQPEQKVLTALCHLLPTCPSVTSSTSATEVDADPEAARTKGSPSGEHGRLGTHWVLTTFILLGDMFGLGTLTLPADFARLGWAVAVPVILVCALGSVYSGVLFARLAKALPSSQNFDDLGYAAYGTTGRRLVYATVYLTILFEPVIFHLICMESLQQMLYTAEVSQLTAGVVVAIAIFPLGLVQGIEEVSSIAILGTIGMLLAVVTATAKLWTLEPVHVSPTEMMHKGHFNTTLVAIMDLVSKRFPCLQPGLCILP